MPLTAIDSICCQQVSETNTFLPPIKVAEVVECVSKYIDGSSQNLQNLRVLINQILPRCFCSYGLWLNELNY